MKRLRNLWLLAFAGVFTCCAENQGKKVAQTVERTPVVPAQGRVINAERQPAEVAPTLEQELVLETFSEVPGEDFVGMGCGLYLSKEDEKKGNYIYLDVGDQAAIKLNGEFVLLNYVGDVEGRRGTIYRNDFVEVERDVTSTEQHPEHEYGSVIKGNLIVTKGKQKVVKNFIGHCGC